MLRLCLGGNIIPTPFHPGPNFPGYAPVQIAAAPMGPRQFLPPPIPQIFYWPYPSPPVSPTNYYPTMPPPPGALPPQQPQQQMVMRWWMILTDGLMFFINFQIPPECVALPPLAPMPAIDARLMGDGIPRQDDKARQNFAPNQYVEIII